LQHPEFDPYAASGAFVQQLLDELLAAGERIKAPGPQGPSN
jgi:hypothetical protein